MEPDADLPVSDQVEGKPDIQDTPALFQIRHSRDGENVPIEDIRDFHHLRLNSGQPLSRKWQFRPAGGHQMATAECANASIDCLPALTTEDFFRGSWSVSYGP